MIQMIKSSVAILDEKDMFKKIELAGRTCYKSEDKITDNSAHKFVSMLIKREHYAPLEHGVLIWKRLLASADYAYELKAKYSKYDFINITITPITGIYRLILSANIRALIESGLIHWDNKKEDLVIAEQLYFDGFICPIDNIENIKYLTNIEKKEHRYTTMRFICDRGVSHELVRHRLFSFCQESTRYVNYLNRGMIFIEPSDYSNMKQSVREQIFSACEYAENTYNNLLQSGCSPQQARAVLPNMLKTEVVVTGNEKEWKHFFELRCSAAAHPDMRRIANIAKKLYIKKYKIKGEI